MNRPELTAIVYALCGVAVLALMDAVMKGVSLAIGAYSAALLRVVCGTAIVAPIWIATRPAWPNRRALSLHIERGFVSAFMGLTFFYALTKLPIAEAIALSFVAPLLALYLAAALLGEIVDRRSIVASVIGFAGTIVIVGGKIGREAIDSDAALGLGSLFVSALLYAYNFIVIRKQSQVAKPLEITVFHSGVSALVLGLGAPFFLQPPMPAQWAQIGTTAILTVTGSMLIAAAYARAEAQKLVPLEYTGFLWACLFGWIWFREQVTLTTAAGALLIVAGTWIASRKPRGAQDKAIAP